MAAASGLNAKEWFYKDHYDYVLTALSVFLGCSKYPENTTFADLNTAEQDLVLAMARKIQKAMQR